MGIGCLEEVVMELVIAVFGRLGVMEEMWPGCRVRCAIAREKRGDIEKSCSDGN